MPFCLQIMNAQNGDQLQGQRPVMPRWQLWALLIRKIRLQMAQVTANLHQRYRRWFYPHYLCSSRVVRETRKANTIAVRRRSGKQVIVLP